MRKRKSRKYPHIGLVLLGILWLLAICALVHGDNLLFSGEISKEVKKALCRFTAPEGIKAVILATGMVSFALSYINTARVQKFKGILMDSVISSKYPMYGAYFVAHGVFVVTGLYSCAIERRISALACLLGVLYCLIYALHMALNVAFSERHRDKLVREYIEATVKNFEPEKRRQYMCVRAQYITRRFLAQDWLINNTDGAENLFSKKGDVAQLLELVDPNQPQNQYKVYSSLQEFKERLFKDCKSVNPDYILCSIPNMSNSIQSFRDEVNLFGEMWRSMLDEIEDKHILASLIYHVLIVTRGWQQPAALYCGLILYLYNLSFSAVHKREESSSKRCAEVLEQIARLNRRDSNIKTCYGSGEYIETLCWDMCLICLCLCVLDQAMAGKELVDYAPLRTTAKDFLDDLDIDTRQDEQSIKINLNP